MKFKALLESRAGEISEKPFVYFRDQPHTFGDLELKVNKVANVLRDLGVKKGDHVCLFLPNCPACR